MGESVFWLVCNTTCYLGAFFYALYKKGWGIYSFSLLFYSIISIGSIYLFTLDSIWNFREITPFPLLYLFVSLMLFMRPLSKFQPNEIVNIIMPNRQFMRILSWVIFFVYLGLFLQFIATSSFSGILNADVLASNYEDKVSKVGMDDNSVNIFGVLKNMFSSIVWLIFIYNWIKGEKKLTAALLFALMSSLLFSLTQGSRGGIMRLFVDIPFIYFVFSDFLPKRKKKIFLMSIIVFVLFALIGFWSLTIGRFGDKTSYSLLDIIVYYSSSNFLMFDNYALDANGIRYGDRVFPLIRLLLGLDITGNYVNRRMAFSNMLLDDSQFSTFVGEFTLDFGPIWGFVILLLFSALLYQGVKHKYRFGFSNILILLLVFKIVIGGYSLFPYSEVGGNLELIYVLFFYILFKYFERYGSRISSLGV